MIPRNLRHGDRAGFTLVEVLVTSALFSVVFLSTVALVRRDRGLSGQVLRTAQIELAAQDLLFSLERDLANAYGERPISIAPAGLGAGEDDLILASSLGFPPSGTVVIDRGLPTEERIAYASLGPGKKTLRDLTRGVACTAEVSHGAQSEVLWGGVAEPLAQQVPPPDADDYDGIAMETTGQVYFRGDGTGFSFRVPVDPQGDGSVMKGDDLEWGAQVPGVGDIASGWKAVYFQPRLEFDEAEFNDDINKDGDRVDVFDIGQLRMVTWDTSDPNTPAFDVGIGPTAILQEQCNYGSDLDGDEFDDPLFLWDPWTNELHIRLYLLAEAQKNQPLVRRVESVVFLRNEPEL